MNVMKFTRRMLLASAVAAVLPVAADDMPFWGEEPNTNRTSSVSYVEPIARFSSQQYFFWNYVMDEFDSRKIGIALIIF